jgi:mono/diheme cytochrome c family protein
MHYNALVTETDRTRIVAGNPILTEEDLFWKTVLYGRGAMPPWEEALSVQQIADIQAWLKTR